MTGAARPRNAAKQARDNPGATSRPPQPGQTQSQWVGPRGASGEANRAAVIATALEALDEVNDIARCLAPLLDALGWEGETRAVAEALPHFSRRLDLPELRDVMAVLGYASIVVADERCNRIDPRLFPCLILPRSGGARVILGEAGPGQVAVVHPDAPDVQTCPASALRGTICLFRRAENRSDARQAAETGGWIRFIARRFRAMYAQVILLTFLAYVLAVAPSVFITAVYDRVIPAQSVETLVALLIAVALALIGEAALRYQRGMILAHVGSRIGLLVASGLFAHLLHLPLALSERLRFAARVQRLRQTDTIRDAFAGSAATTLIELPFALVFLVALGLIGGPLGLVPLGAIFIYAAAAWLLAPVIRHRSAEATRHAVARQDFLAETITQHQQIRLLGAGPKWRARHNILSGNAAYSAYRAAMVSALTTAIGQIVMVLTGILTITLGAMLVMHGTMTVGVLIGVMTLTWRALSPIQAGFMLFTRLEQLRAAIANLDQAMKSPQERNGLSAEKDVAPVQAGRISFLRVSFKYGPDQDPALLGITAEIAPGEIIAVTGSNGSGKSALLKLVMGLYEPQAGNILIDGIDIAQHAPITLRQQIGYVPQEFELFYGTIRQNLRLSLPTAADVDIEMAARRAGIHHVIEALPKGYGHLVGDGRSSGVSAMLLNGIALAAAYLRDSQLMLVDEAIDNLDEHQTKLFYEQINVMRGHVTTIMVTHRPATMRLADRVIVLNGGAITKIGKPADVLR